MKSRILATIGLLLLASVASAQESERPITLAEAVDLAQKNALRMIEARGTVRTSEAEKRSAYAAFLPSVTLSMGATRQLPYRGAATRIENGQVVTLPNEPWTYSTGAGANVQLFAGGRRLFQVSEAKAGERSAQSNELAQRFGAILDVKQQYFNVLAYREAAIAAQAEIDQAEQQFRAASLRVRAGSATVSDSLRSEIQLRNARLDLSSARNNIAVANASLTRAVGTPYPVTASEADTATLVGLSLTEMELRDLAEQGPDVQVAKAELDRAKSASKASKSPFLPTISASYNYLGSGTDSRFGLGDDPYAYNGSLRLALSYPIFDQLGREEQVVRASVAEENAKAALRDATLAARQSFATYLAAYRTAEERVEAQTASLNSALEDLRVQQRRYDLGASTLLDLLASQTQVNNTREALIRARYDQRIAKAQLEALVGRSL